MRIIVGIDDTAGSRAALRYALRESAARSAQLVVVHAWQPPFEAVYPYGATQAIRAAAVRDAARLVDTMVADARDQVRRPVERVVARPVQGDAADVLTTMARDTDLLVVG